MIKVNQIYNDDCFNIMPMIDVRSIDFILSDLPYGQTAPLWDKRLDLNKLWLEYKRIIKPNGVIALFGSQPFTTELINSNLNDFKYCWYWLKNQATNFFHAKRMPLRKVEEICIFGGSTYYPQISNGNIPTNSAIGLSSGITYHGINKRNYTGGETTRYPTNILEFSCVNNYARIHSSEKPIKLIEYLINTYTDVGDLVLDNCSGSGVVGEACLNLKRNFILIDIDPVSCTKAANRIGVQYISY